MTSKTVREETKATLRKLTDAGFIVNVSPSFAKDLNNTEAGFQRVLNEMYEDQLVRVYYIPEDRGSKPIHTRVIASPDTNYKMIVGNLDKIVTISEATTRLEARESDNKNPKKLPPEDIKWMVFHMRNCKRQGMSNVAIAKEFGVNESTVRYHLRKPLTSEEKLMETMIDAVRDAREMILTRVVNTPEFLGTFGAGYGPEYFLKIEKAKHDVKIHKSSALESMSFKLEFTATKVKDNR